jgi:acyl dehydratase
MLKTGEWEKYVEGLRFAWQFSFSTEDMKTFAKLSNDWNPMHTDPEFAKTKGFDRPLVYGLLLSSQISRLIGQELPDKNAILTGMQMDFIRPCHPGDQLSFSSILIRKSESVYGLEFKCRIKKNEETACRGIANAIWRP